MKPIYPRENKNVTVASTISRREILAGSAFAGK